jgi:hypothetical protein
VSCSSITNSLKILQNRKNFSDFKEEEKIEKKYLDNGLSKVLKSHNAQKRRVINEKKADAQQNLDKSKI